jgi:hypothetical protein
MSEGVTGRHNYGFHSRNDANSSAWHRSDAIRLQIRPCINADYAWQCGSSRGVYGGDQRMGVGGSQDGGMGLAVMVQISCVFCGTDQEVFVFPACDGLTKHGVIHNSAPLNELGK